MPDLEPSITAWRKTLMAAPNVGRETLDELENHLRETVEQLVRSGVPETEAFQRAVAQLGPPESMALEFQKLNAARWLPVTAVTAVGAAAAVLLAAYLVSLIQAPGRGVLLLAHVLMITLGYGTAWLLGVLGICFVCQRCIADFSPRRLQFLSRVSFIYGQIALWLTVAGTVLGMIWSHGHWGRYWRWDASEIGALSVVVWLICFLSAHRWSRISARGLFVLSILGSNVVSLAWFGPNLLAPGLHSYGRPDLSLFLLVTMVANFLFFVAGMAPAGWLRRRRA